MKSARVQKRPATVAQPDTGFSSRSGLNLAAWIVSIGLVTALASPFTAHQSLLAGIWPKVEPTIILLHTSAAICSFGLFWAFFTAKDIVTPCIRHPVVLLATGISLWSIAVAPVSRYPLLSITGAPQIADGALLWLDMAVFIAGIRLVRLSPRHIETIGFSILFAAIALPLLALFPATRGLWFNDHLAFLGIAAAVCVPEALRGRIEKPTSRIALALLAGLPALMISKNASAIAMAALISLPLFAAAHFALRHGNKERVTLTRYVAAAIVVLTAITAPFLIKWFGGLDLMASMTSRALIFDILVDYLADHPMSLLTGNGWGHTELLFAESLAGTTATIWDQSWDATWRDIFHSHNLVLEALLSGGVPAAIGVVAFFAMVPLISGRNNLPVSAAYACGYVGITSLWFQMPGTIPFTAMAIAMLTGSPRSHAPDTISPIAIPAALIMATAIQISIVILLATYSWGFHHTTSTLAALEKTGTTPGASVVCDTFPNESWRGDSGLSLEFIKAFNLVAAPRNNRAVNPADIKKIKFYACTATARGLSGLSPTLLRAGLLFRSQLAYNPAFAQYRGGMSEYLEDWEGLARLYLDVEPARFDLAYPFLSWSLLQNQYSVVMAMTDTALAHDPNDAIALWFKGLALHQRGKPEDRPRARRYLQSGLQQGVEKWFNIPEEIKRAIQTQGSVGPPN